MKEFVIIDEKIGAVISEGFKLDLAANTEFDSKATSNDIDSFKDLIGATLCKDEQGDFYAVEFDYRTGHGQPFIWQKIVPMNFSEKIKEVLNRKRSTVAGAAKYLDVPFRTFQNWELGFRTPPPYVQTLVLRLLEEMPTNTQE